MTFDYLTSLGKNPGMPILIGPGVLRCTDELIASVELTGQGVAIYDDDAYRAIKNKPQVFRNLLYDHEQLYCDRQAIDFLHYTEQHIEECDFVLAIGGEAIQGIAKMICAEMHMPYIAIPTCAFGTGIASRYADMATPEGFTRAKGTSPAAIVADTALMAQADESIALGAVRELIDRAGALARCQAIALAAGYEWDQSLADIQHQAITAALSQVNTGLRQGKTEAYDRLTEALIACGLADNAVLLSDTYPARLHFLNEKPLKEVPDHE